MRARVATLRHRLYEILEHGPIGDRGGRLVGRAIVALIVVNLVTVVIESVPAYEAEFGAALHAIEYVSLAVFTIGFLATCFLAMLVFWVVVAIAAVGFAGLVAGAAEVVAGAALGAAGWLFWAKAGRLRASTPATVAARERRENLVFMAGDPVVVRLRSETSRQRDRSVR